MRIAALPTVLAFVALAVVGGGCGDDDDEGAGRGATATSEAASDGVPAGVAAQYRQIEQEVRAEGGDARVGPWRVAYIVEPAEGWFERRGGALRWRAPAPTESITWRSCRSRQRPAALCPTSGSRLR